MQVSTDGLDELDYVAGLPGPFSITFEPVEWENVEWARRTGYDAAQRRPVEIEGATFVDMDEDCWILGMKGAQPLHSDRHMMEVAPEKGGHCWNAVIEADGDQMLLVRETDEGYRHFRLQVGTMIYFNTYQPHLVSRTNAQDVSVIVQVGGIGPDEPQRALEAMRQAVAERRTARGGRAA